MFKRKRKQAKVVENPPEPEEEEEEQEITEEDEEVPEDEEIPEIEPKKKKIKVSKSFKEKSKVEKFYMIIAGQLMDNGLTELKILTNSPASFGEIGKNNKLED